MEILLANKANVNALDKYGRSALHKAAYEGRSKVVELLLRTPGIFVDVEELWYLILLLILYYVTYCNKITVMGKLHCMQHVHVIT